MYDLHRTVQNGFIKEGRLRVHVCLFNGGGRGL